MHSFLFFDLKYISLDDWPVQSFVLLVTLRNPFSSTISTTDNSEKSWIINYQQREKCPERGDTPPVELNLNNFQQKIILFSFIDKLPSLCFLPDFRDKKVC